MAAAAIPVGAVPIEHPGAWDGLLRWNLPRGVTETSHQVYDMHMMVALICILIGLFVFAALLWTIVRYRRSQGAVAAGFSSDIRLEVVWTLVPALILIAMLVPTTRVLLAINRPSPSEQPALTVRITGSQWKWKYSYPDLSIAFSSNLAASSREASRKNASPSPATVPQYLREVDRPLVLPSGQRIRLQITSEDVIHSWWVPAFGFKRDAIPGYLNLMEIAIDRPGWYYGQCAELCGIDHAYMPIVVHAVPPADFERWVEEERQRQETERYALAARPWTMDEAMAQGKTDFDADCAACHQQNGEGIPGVFPALKGSQVVTGPLPDHIRFVLQGSPRNPAMRAFGPELNDRQLAGILTYERNAWGNNMGDLVTPRKWGRHDEHADRGLGRRERGRGSARASARAAAWLVALAGHDQP